MNNSASLTNLRKLAHSLGFFPFHVIESRTKKGKFIQWKGKTKEELSKEINSLDPKLRKKLRKVSFASQTTNNAGNSKSLVITPRQGRCPRLERTRIQQRKCNDVEIKKNCKFTRKGNQPEYSKECMKHFPCFHKKGFAELTNANNYKH